MADESTTPRTVQSAGTTDVQHVEAAVPQSMLEPAQALDAAAGTGVASAAGAAAAPVLPHNIVVTQRRQGPGLILRAVWYLVIGWWLTGIAMAFAWLCAASIILLPIAYFIVNKIPTILTLRPRSIQTDVVIDSSGTIQITTGGVKQRPFWQRGVWFLLIGWWACGLAMGAAYLLCLTVVLIPVGLMIFNRVPAVMTLQRN